MVGNLILLDGSLKCKIQFFLIGYYYFKRVNWDVISDGSVYRSLVKAMDLKINRASILKPHPLDEDKLGFGQYFSDHMLVQRYDESAGGWQPAEIRPYGLIDLEPASACLHYSQIVWEGMKCYRTANGLKLFRPRENFYRLNRSAERMCMPQVDVEYTLSALKELLKIDQEWIPHKPQTSLYIRPCMLASEPFLGLHRAHRYLFFIILSPSGPYFRQGFNPIKILVETKYVRAVRGGTGDVKTPGNYGASLRSVEEAMQQGYSNTLWLDSQERK